MDARTPALSARNTVVDPTTVPGWGVDASEDNNPTWPMRDHSQDQHEALNWERPPLQTPEVEILQSVEHNRLPAVFGTPNPPRGLSGVLRRAAFEWSESRLPHWLLLMAADRVNVVEGLVDDLLRGHIPNLPKELGLPAMWKYDRPALYRRAATTVAVAGVAFTAAWLISRNRRRR
jgi:hypothetical protein